MEAMERTRPPVAPVLRLRSAAATRADRGRKDEYGRELVGVEMAFECRIDQRASPRTIEGGIAVKLNGKTGNPWLPVNAQIQRLEHMIELAQIVVDQMDGEIRGLSTGYTPSKPETLRVVAGLCASS